MPAKCPPRPRSPAKSARGRKSGTHRRKRTYEWENGKNARFLTAICKKALSAAFWQRKGENTPRIFLSRSASPFPHPAPDFSTRKEKNLRNFSSPLFARKSILHFAQSENNILPSVLKRGFLQRSLIKISAFENSRPRPSSLSRPCRPPSAAFIPHTTHRSSRAFSLSPVPPQCPRQPDSRAIYEKTIFRPLYMRRAFCAVYDTARGGIPRLVVACGRGAI